MYSSVNTIALVYKSQEYFLLSKQEIWHYTDNEKDKIIVLAGEQMLLDLKKIFK